MGPLEQQENSRFDAWSLICRLVVAFVLTAIVVAVLGAIGEREKERSVHYQPAAIQSQSR